MAIDVILPKLGQTMDEGTIVEWVKKEGDAVKRGDLLFTVESDKAVLDVEATARGYLRKILVGEGQAVPVLTVVAIMTRKADEEYEYASIQGTGEQGVGVRGPGVLGERPSVLGERPSVLGKSAQVARQAEPVAEVGRGEAGAARAEGGRIFASPRARKTAREQGVDLALVTGTGPGGRITEGDVLATLAAQPKATPVAARTAEVMGVDLATVRGSGASGRITKADVEAAAQIPVPAPAEAPSVEPLVETIPVTGLRRIIAQRMAASHSATARVTLVTEADATDLVKAREGLKASVTDTWGFSPGFNDLLGLIVARALREFPYVNARLSADGTRIERLPYVNLGLAVDTERGLLVPVIRDADQKGLRAFGSEFRTLAERARAGKSLPDDLSGGTFTITNLGMYDIDAFTPIINLPEAAILGAGRIQAKPAVHEGVIVPRQMWTLSLTFDHRLVDGAPAARFLQRIKELIEFPLLLLS